MIASSDSKTLCTKALEVMSFVDQELGYSIQNTNLPSTKKVSFLICF